jgi:hypothetical protein
MMSIALAMRPPICLKALLSGLSTEGGRPVRGLYPWRSARARRPACVILTCVTSTGLPAAKVRPGVRARASLLRSMRRSGDKPGSGAELRVPPRRHLFPLRPALDCFRKPGKPRRGGAQCFVFCGIDVMGIVADQSPASSGSRRNSLKPNVPSRRTNMSTHRNPSASSRLVSTVGRPDCPCCPEFMTIASRNPRPAEKPYQADFVKRPQRDRHL